MCTCIDRNISVAPFHGPWHIILQHVDQFSGFHAQIKCDQYWPTRGTESYGVMLITLVDVIELATYTIRTFLVTRVSNWLRVVSNRIRFVIAYTTESYWRFIIDAILFSLYLDNKKLHPQFIYGLILKTQTLMYLTMQHCNELSSFMELKSFTNNVLYVNIQIRNAYIQCIHRYTHTHTYTLGWYIH